MEEVLRNTFLRLFIKPDSLGEDRHRRVYMALVALSYPVAAAVFVIGHFREGRTEEGLIICMAIAAVLSCLLFTRFATEVRWAFRICGVIVVSVMAYQLAVNGGGGYASFWFYLVPPAAFYLLGSREGAVWSAAFYIVGVALMLRGLGTDYPAELVSRFIVSYFIVIILAGRYQISRESLLAKLESEKEELREALGQVKTLSGMLPLCAWCRKIRDDDGYWSQLEDYLREKTDAEVSHSLCPECAEKLDREGDD